MLLKRPLFASCLSLKPRTIMGRHFPGGSDGKASVYNVGDLGSIPGSGRFPGEGNGNPLQYSCLENPMDRGAWCRLLSMGSQRVRHDWVTSLHFTGVLSIPFSSWKQWFWKLPPSCPLSLSSLDWLLNSSEAGISFYHQLGKSPLGSYVSFLFYLIPSLCWSSPSYFSYKGYIEMKSFRSCISKNTSILCSHLSASLAGYRIVA